MSSVRYLVAVATTAAVVTGCGFFVRDHYAEFHEGELRIELQAGLGAIPGELEMIDGYVDTDSGEGFLNFGSPEGYRFGIDRLNASGGGDVTITAPDGRLIAGSFGRECDLSGLRMSPSRVDGTVNCTDLRSSAFQ